MVTAVLHRNGRVVVTILPSFIVKCFSPVFRRRESSVRKSLIFCLSVGWKSFWKKTVRLSPGTVIDVASLQRNRPVTVVCGSKVQCCVEVTRGPWLRSKSAGKISGFLLPERDKVNEKIDPPTPLTLRLCCLFFTFSTHEWWHFWYDAFQSNLFHDKHIRLAFYSGS